MLSSTRSSATKIRGLLSLIIVILAGLAGTALGQSAAARPDRGIRPVGSYSATDIESISLTNGNLNLSIPLASLPPIAGGKLGLTLRASYNSKLWDVARWERKLSPFADPFVQDVPQLGSTGGWRIGAGYSLVFHDSREDFNWLAPTDPNDPEYCLLTGNQFVKLILTTPDGATHEMRPLDYSPYQFSSHPNLWGYYKERPDSICTSPQLCPPGGCTSSAMRYYSFDGSFIWAKYYPPGGQVIWEVYLPDGTHIVQRNNGQNLWDSNSLNRIRIWSEFPDPYHPSWITTHFVDQQTGREIKYVFDATGAHVQYQSAYGTWMSIDIIGGQTLVDGKTYVVEDQFPNGASCQRLQLLQANVDVIRQIVLPVTEPGQPGRSFTFSYNSDGSPESYTQQWQGACDSSPTTIFTASKGWGSLSTMTTPTGATVSYSYKMDGVHRLTLADSGYENLDLPRDSITHKEVAHDETVDSWDYTAGPVGGSVTAHVTGQPDETTTETCYNHDPAYNALYGLVDDIGGLVYRTNRSGKEIIERHWTKKKFFGANDIMPGTLIKPPFNPVVDAEYTTVIDPVNSANNKMSAKLYQYDYNGNITTETDYDWFNANSVSRDSFGVPMGVPGGVPILRVMTTNYYNPAPVSSDTDSPNVYAKRLLATATPLILNAPQEVIVGTSQTRFSYDSQSYGLAPTGGNLTKEERWDNRANKWLPTTHVYDTTYANLTSTTDALGNITSFVYDGATHAQPVSVTVDPLNGTGQQTIQTSYDYSTGLVLTQTEVNGKTTSIDYTNQRTFTVDPFGRPGVVTGPAVSSSFFDSGGNYTTLANQQRKVVTRYFDSIAQQNNARQVEVWTDLKQQGDSLLRTRTTSDQLGRPVKAETSENGSTYSISSQSVYSQMGRITFSSNPTRNSGESTDGWTRSTKDNAGRLVEVSAFSGASQPPATGTNANWTGSVTTSYNAEQTTVTDQAGKTRRSIIDGLGRLKQVIEDPNSLNFATTYSYDVLGSLTLVQQGAQQRQFTYDSVSRLREAFNPEQQMVATVYQYDDGSNLLSRANPNGTSVSFTYDGLNRVKTKTLSTGGLWNYSYDTGTNGKGRLVSVVKQGVTDGCYYDGYDAVGKLSGSHQITDGVSYTLSYGYDLAGSMTKQVYPSGKEVRTSYDNAGRITGVSRYIGGAFDKTYASQFSYTAHGVAKALQLGNAKWEHTNFNSRYQPTLIGLGTSSSDSSILQLTYGYGTTTNNGNVATQAITIGGTPINQSYGYDGLNRLSSATETVAWSQTYDYDRYGNRAVRSGSYIPQPSLTPPSAFAGDMSAFNPSNNRIVLVGFGYDTSGNLTADPTTAINAMVYDAENRQTSYTKGATNSYSYDGDGHRVKKIDNDGTTVFVYNAGGQLIAEYHSDPVPPAAGGGGTSYLTSDHLGSTRVVTRSDGTVKARYDYLPFGEEIPSTIGVRGSVVGYAGADSTRQKFTQKERDTESGLDYFLARYYSSAQGRFTSPDEFTGGPDDLFDFAEDASANPTFYADLHEPQSLNKYQYAYNNPLRYVDPDGHGIKDWLKSAAQTAGEFAGGVALGVAASMSYGTAPHSGPSADDSISSRLGQAVGSALVIVGGTQTASGGVAVSGTGVGALVGVPVAVAGVVAVAGGVVNAARVVTTPIHQKGGIGPSGEKSPGVSSSGHPTDQHGNKLGPSGKPMVNTVRHSSVKGAKDTARAEGKRTPVKHPSPMKGSGHFHPTDKKGKKVPTSTHHEYPK